MIIILNFYLILNLKKFLLKKNYIFKEYYKPKVDESISYKRYGTFFIDFFKNDLILTDYKGNVYLIKILIILYVITKA